MLPSSLKNRSQTDCLWGIGLVPIRRNQWYFNQNNCRPIYLTIYINFESDCHLYLVSQVPLNPPGRKNIFFPWIWRRGMCFWTCLALTGFICGISEDEECLKCFLLSMCHSHPCRGLRSLWLVASSTGGEGIAVTGGFSGWRLLWQRKSMVGESCQVTAKKCTSRRAIALLLKRQFILKSNNDFLY